MAAAGCTHQLSLPLRHRQGGGCQQVPRFSAGLQPGRLLRAEAWRGQRAGLACAARGGARACTVQHALHIAGNITASPLASPTEGQAATRKQGKACCPTGEKGSRASGLTCPDRTSLPPKAPTAPAAAPHLGAHSQHRARVEGALQRLGVGRAQGVAQRATRCARGRQKSWRDQGASSSSERKQQGSHVNPSQCSRAAGSFRCNKKGDVAGACAVGTGACTAAASAASVRASPTPARTFRQVRRQLRLRVQDVVVEVPQQGGVVAGEKLVVGGAGEQRAGRRAAQRKAVQLPGHICRGARRRGLLDGNELKMVAGKCMRAPQAESLPLQASPRLQAAKGWAAQQNKPVTVIEAPSGAQ